MSKLNKFFIILIVIGFLGWGFPLLAQDVSEDVNLDENVQPEDLRIGEPRILPDHPLYFLKNWARGIRSFFAFNPISKAELKMKFTNEKLMEVKKMIEQKKEPEKIKRAAKNYQRELGRLNKAIEKIKEKARENPRVESFLDKFIDQQILHQKLLQKLENQVSVEAFEKIKEAREEHLARFQEVMLKLEDRKEKITENLNNILEKQKGSQFKHFKNLEVLLELEEKVPEEAKEAIRKAQENSFKRLQDNLEKMSSQDQEKFKEYLERISGEKERHLEILENLRSEIQSLPETPGILKLKEKLGELEKIKLEEIKEKVEKRLGCPSPPLRVCPEGRSILKKDERGCIISQECLVPGETLPLPPGTIIAPEGPRFCITLWDPVCGKNGRTYSNQCFAKLSGVEIKHKGICEPIPSEPIPSEPTPSEPISSEPIPSGPIPTLSKPIPGEPGIKTPEPEPKNHKVEATYLCAEDFDACLKEGWWSEEKKERIGRDYRKVNPPGPVKVSICSWSCELAKSGARAEAAWQCLKLLEEICQKIGPDYHATPDLKKVTPVGEEICTTPC